MVNFWSTEIKYRLYTLFANNLLKRHCDPSAVTCFARDVIENIIMQIMINLPQNFDRAYKSIQRLSVSNLKGFGPMKTELWAKEVGEFLIMLY